MRISLDAAEEGERAAVETLLDAYLRELSGFRTQPIDDTSAAEYFWLSHYWSEPDRFPFLIRVDGELSGFALVRCVSDAPLPRMQVAEIFVSPPHRRHGVGSAAVALLWARFRGEWELHVSRSNAVALQFWSMCITKHAGVAPTVEAISAADGPRLLFRFRVA